MSSTEKYFNSKYKGSEMEERLDQVEIVSKQVSELNEKIESLASEDINWTDVQ